MNAPLWAQGLAAALSEDFEGYFSTGETLVAGPAQRTASSAVIGSPD